MRQEYSVKNDRLGITFSPANSARPSSNTDAIAWLVRAAPVSFSASRERIAAPAGTIRLPGRPASCMISSKRERASSGMNRNSPPNSVRNSRGIKSNARTSAVAAGVTPTRGARSSSARRGSRANPSADRIAQIAGGESVSPSAASAAVIS